MTKPLKTISRLLIILVIVSPVLAVRVERLIDTWRPEHYLVNITLNNQLSEITSASARINVLVLKPTNLIDLDFGDLTTETVTLNSQPVPFTHKNGKLQISLTERANPGTRLVVTINYRGKPKDGLIFTNDKDGKPSAVGDNWPDRVHHWIPTLDHPSAKATITFNITAPAREEVVANGRLDHVETTADGQRTWTYSEGVPIPPYCMIIGVGQFARVEPAQQALTPLSYYVPQSEKLLAEKGFSPTIPSLEFFTQTIAPYPYEKLAMIVGATRFGGMENSSRDCLHGQSIFAIRFGRDEQDVRHSRRECGSDRTRDRSSVVWRFGNGVDVGGPVVERGLRDLLRGRVPPALRR